MKMLLVEDVAEKIARIKPALSNESIQVVAVQTVLDAKKCLLTEKFDLLILDIQLPDDFGEMINSRGGVDLVDWLYLHESCNKPDHIIALTSHKDTVSEHSKFFNSKGITFIETRIDDSEWLDFVVGKVDYISKCVSHRNIDKFDVCIITAMSHNELRAIRDVVSINWTEFKVKSDPTIYYSGEVKTLNGNKKILAASCSRMGMPSAASLASKMCIYFEPDFLFMTGIAAGIETKTNIGDLLIADPSWDWGNGKLTEGKGGRIFKAAPHQISLSPRLRMTFQKIRDERKYLDEIRHSWRGVKPETPLELHIGPLASGAVVLEDKETIDDVLIQHRETIGIEMEAYSVMMAPTVITNRKVETVIIKSVCDFANPDKNDNWQDYASYTSAEFAIKFIQNELFND